MRSRMAAAVLIALAAPAAAQQVPAAPALLQQMREAADAGQVVQARRLAEEVARAAPAQPAATEALWMIAQIDNADGRALRAAGALDQAAEHAAAYGDPVMQARSLLEAATLYVAHRRYAAAAERIERLRPLLQSPYMPAEVRADAERRLSLHDLPTAIPMGARAR